MCRLEENTGVIMYTSTSNIARVDLKVQQASQLSAVTMLSHEKYKVYVWGERETAHHYSERDHETKTQLVTVS